MLPTCCRVRSLNGGCRSSPAIAGEDKRNSNRLVFFIGRTVSVERRGLAREAIAGISEASISQLLRFGQEASYRIAICR